MIKKTIKYTDFNEKVREEDFYFNLTKAELVELQITAPGGDLSAHIQALMDASERKELMAAFKEIVTMSFGVRSEDGRYFEKSPKQLLRFQSSAAYSELFIELISDPDALSAFVRGLVPEGLKGALEEDPVSTAETARERSEAQLSGFKKKENKPKESVQVVPELPTAPPVLEKKPEVDLSSLSKEELIAAMQSNQQSFLK